MLVKFTAHNGNVVAINPTYVSIVALPTRATFLACELSPEEVRPFTLVRLHDGNASLVCGTIEDTIRKLNGTA